MPAQSETRFQRIKNRMIVALGLVVFIGLPSVWLSQKVIQIFQWQMPIPVHVIVTIVISSIFFVALASAAVSMTLGFMSMLKG